MVSKSPLLPFRSLILALGATLVLSGAAVPARADDDDWRHERREHERREWREHEAREHWHEREWREWCARHPGAYAGPGYACPIPAPPAVVYAPPPPPPAVIYTPPPSLDIVVPIHIR